MVFEEEYTISLLAITPGRIDVHVSTMMGSNRFRWTREGESSEYGSGGLGSWAWRHVKQGEATGAIVYSALAIRLSRLVWAIPQAVALAEMYSLPKLPEKFPRC